MRAWVMQFNDWWLHSKARAAVADFVTNIGSNYELNVLTMAMYASQGQGGGGSGALARSIADSNHTRARIDAQIDSAGQFFREAPRPDGFGYAIGDALELVDLARATAAASGGTTDLLHYVSANGSSLEDSVAWLAPFCAKATNCSCGGSKAKKKPVGAVAECIGWPHHEVASFTFSRCKLLFAQAGKLYKNTSWLAIAAAAPSSADPFLTFGLDMDDWVQLLYADLSKKGSPARRGVPA